MKTSSTFFVFACAIGLAGCNLSEAERMDLSRKEISGISCKVDDFRYKDSDSIPLSDLLRMDYHQNPNSFKATIADRGTEDCGVWTFKAIYHNDTIFTYQVSPSEGVGLFSGIQKNAPWFEGLDQVHFLVSSTRTDAGQALPNLRIYDDRPPLVASLLNDTSKIKLGDTIRISLKNTSTKDSIVVSSDYVGMRMIDDYVATLPPGQESTMRWLVLINSDPLLWIDVGWGEYGQSKRFAFKTH